MPIDVERDAYLEMAATEDRHWWFVGRRRITTALVQKVLEQIGCLAGDARILEIGAGTGGNLSWLSRFGRVTAVEMNAEAREIARTKSGIDVLPGSLPLEISLPDSSFDLVVMFDVLEHIAEDTAALERVARLLAPGGRLLVTVPAYPWLWSRHDLMLHHKRRYTRSVLGSRIESAGLQLVRTGYFNGLLLPLAIAGRLVERVTNSDRGTGTRIPGGGLNEFLGWVFGLERFVVPTWSLPFGLSLMAIAGRAGVVVSAEGER